MKKERGDRVYIDMSVYTGNMEGRDGIIVYEPFFNDCEGWWESTIKSEGIITQAYYKPEYDLWMALNEN